MPIDIGIAGFEAYKQVFSRFPKGSDFSGPDGNSYHVVKSLPLVNNKELKDFIRCISPLEVRLTPVGGSSCSTLKMSLPAFVKAIGLKLDDMIQEQSQPQLENNPSSFDPPDDPNMEVSHSKSS